MLSDRPLAAPATAVASADSSATANGSLVDDVQATYREAYATFGDALLVHLQPGVAGGSTGVV